MNRLKNRKGQSLVEYILITAIVAIGALAVLRTMGQSVSGKFAQITHQIQGGNQADVHIDAVTQDQYQKVDMSNFMRDGH